MKQSTHNSTVPAAILRKLRLVQKRSMVVQVACALVAAATVLLAAMGVAMFIDWLAMLYDSRWRVVLTTIAITAAICTSIGWIIVAWRRAQRLDRVAAEVDRQTPPLEERWTTMTRLGEDSTKTEVIHPAMFRRLSSEATSWEPRIEPHEVVSLSTLMRTIIGLTAVTAILAVAVVLDSREVLVLAHRFWLPGASISATKLVDVPGDLVIARGEPLALNASIDGRLVEIATLFLQPQEKPAQTVRLVAEHSRPIAFSHRMRTVDEPFAYRFRAGDGQSEWFNVDVADRPDIEAIKLIVTPPAYTRQPARTFDKLPERLSALRNSRIEVALRSKAAVATAQLKMDNNQVATLPLGADGWYRWTRTLGESFSITPVLTEQHGLTNRRQPKCELIAYEDQPPVVKVLAPNDRMAVRPEDSIQITFSAADDVGIGTAELVVYQEGDQKEPTQLAAIPIDLGEQQGARQVQQTVDLDLKKFGTKNGAELSYEIRVREDRGTDQPRIATRASSEKNANPQQALVERNAKDKSATHPQGKLSAPVSPATTIAAAGAPGQTSSADSQSSQKGTNANRNAASQTPPMSAYEQMSGKPNPGALAANETTTPGQSPANERSRPMDQTAGHSSAQSAGSIAAPNVKATAPEKTKTASATSTPTKNAPGPAAPQTASSVVQALATNTKNPDGQSAKSTAAIPSSAVNSGAAKAATTEMKHPPANPAKLANIAANMAKNQTAKPAASQSKNSVEPPEPRTATSGRKSLSADSNPANSSEQPVEPQQASSPQDANSSNQNSPTSNTAAATKEASKSDKSMGGANQTQSPSSSKSSPSDPSQTASSQSTPPGENMPKRTLDVAQSGSSQRMRLKVDQWAGSFEGQQRAKLEMAISPELEALDQKLAKAQRTVRGVLDGLAADRSWVAAYDREVASTQQLVVDGKGIIEKLVKQSKDTPYAFIGLQLADLDVAHLEPARSSFWSAVQSKGDDRQSSVHDGWQHLGRARQLLADLRGQFERSKRDFQLAEAVERAKKMYQVYVENSQALLEMHDSDPDRYNRKMAEFNLDDEYLKRLKEVLKMRTELEAELARILGDDPRLLRRYMDNLRARSNNLREQLADLTAKQEGLNREVRAWAAIAESDRQPMARLFLMQHLQEAARLAKSAGELQDRYQSWLPLQKESKDSTLVAVSKQIQDVATAAGELKSRAENYIATEQQAVAAAPVVPAPAPAPMVAPTADAAKPQAAVDSGQVLDQVIAQSESLYGQLAQLEVSLRQLASREDQAEVAVFAANRLVQTRRLIADASAWIRQIKAHKAGSYTGAAEVTQYRLAMKTDELAGKLGSLELQLAGLLQRPDRSLPEPIANKSREFMAALDKEAAPNQLAAVYALHSNQPPRATERQQLAGAALAKAEKLYDELMRLAITELDKLPVQDPIASLLEDPTLDELLAQLEQELPLQELLGIPNRPSNLRIIGDWTKPGGKGGGGGMNRMAMNQMREQDKRSQEKLKQAYQRAIARALKETTPKRTAKVAKSTKLSDWNKLVSHLGDDLRQGRDKAPPEQYRQAIEQYFARISRVMADQEKKSP